MSIGIESRHIMDILDTYLGNEYLKPDTHILRRMKQGRLVIVFLRLLTSEMASSDVNV